MSTNPSNPLHLPISVLSLSNPRSLTFFPKITPRTWRCEYCLPPFLTLPYFPWRAFTSKYQNKIRRPKTEDAQPLRSRVDKKIKYIYIYVNWLKRKKNRVPKKFGPEFDWPTYFIARIRLWRLLDWLFLWSSSYSVVCPEPGTSRLYHCDDCKSVGRVYRHINIACEPRFLLVTLKTAPLSS